MNKVDLNISKHVEQKHVNNSKDPNRTAQAEKASKPSGAASESEADKIKVSERAADIGRLTTRASGLPDVRQEKVEALRERVQSGSYNPSPGDIADAIIKEEN